MAREDTTIDHYSALEIPLTATTDDVKRQFRKLALKYHPDRNPGRETEFNAKFQQIQAAHELLTDPVRRKVYDRTRAQLNVGHKSTSQPFQHHKPPTQTSRKPTAGRSGFDSGARNAEVPNPQWEYVRPFPPNGASAWKSGQERWQQRSSRETPRTPKKTRENPYTTTENTSIPNTPKESVSAERFPSRNGFFAGRNPREKEWMDHKPSPTASTGTNPAVKPRGDGPKTSEEENIRPTSTSYSYTPRSKLSTNFRDSSPDAPSPRTAGDTGANMNGDYDFVNETPVSPIKPGPFNRGPATREIRHGGELGGPTQTADRRKSGSSTGTDNPERRRFSYLFNEDGSRKPHRNPKAAAMDCDQNEDDTPSYTRGHRKSYPNSRRNTLERDINGLRTHEDMRYGSQEHTEHIKSDALPESIPGRMARSTILFKAAATTSRDPADYFDKSESNSTTGNSGTTEGKQSSSFKNAEDVAGARSNRKSFSVDDWNNVFTNNENVFAVPSRKHQASPRKGAAGPKSQNSHHFVGIDLNDKPLNFSRPRPTSVSGDFDESRQPPRKMTSFCKAESIKGVSLEKMNGSDRPPQPGPFVFKDWEKAFAESNPFDVPQASSNQCSHTPRAGVRIRKTNNPKKATPIVNQNRLNSHDSGNVAFQSDDITDNQPHTSNETKKPTDSTPNSPVSSSKDHQDPVSAAPSPLAMDIDLPTTPIAFNSKQGSKLHSSRTLGNSASVQSSNSFPPAATVSPIQSTRRPSDQLAQGEGAQSRSSTNNTFSQPRTRTPRTSDLVTDAAFDLNGLGSVEPLSYGNSGGLGGHWHGLKDTLPFESMSSAPRGTVSLGKNTVPKPPPPPVFPHDYNAAVYDKHSATMTIYQTSWNEYNAQVLSHFRARLDLHVERFAQSKILTSSGGVGIGSSIQSDLAQAKKTSSELTEDKTLREQWMQATEVHSEVLMRWGEYLDKIVSSGASNDH